MNNLGLVFLWLQLSLNNSGGACAVLNFSDDLLVLVRLHNLDDLRRSTLRNIVDDVLTASENFLQHMDDVKVLQDKCREKNITLNKIYRKLAQP